MARKVDEDVLMLPSAGVMKPKPLSALNHLTKPVILFDIRYSFYEPLIGKLVCATESTNTCNGGNFREGISDNALEMRTSFSELLSVLQTDCAIKAQGYLLARFILNVRLRWVPVRN